MTEQEREMVELWRQLTKDQQEVVKAMMQGIIKAEREKRERQS